MQPSFNLAADIATKMVDQKAFSTVFLTELYRAWTLSADCFLRRWTKQLKMIS